MGGGCLKFRQSLLFGVWVWGLAFRRPKVQKFLLSGAGCWVLGTWVWVWKSSL
jgi:hypothetical protein